MTRELEEWARRIAGWDNIGNDVYVYFSNDWHGYAVKNGLWLKRRLLAGRAERSG